MQDETERREKTMSSAKPSVNRQLVYRWGVVIVALAVLAAGCSQSEDGVSQGSTPATSTSLTGLSSAAPLSPAEEGTATSTSLSELGTATTQASEEPSGSGSEIATTTTSLSPAVVEGALSDEVVGLIDVAVDACADLLEFKCAEATAKACLDLRIDFGVILEEDDEVSEPDIVALADTRGDICRLAGISYYWELSVVLSSKYGEKYYSWSPGFVAFRDDYFWTARYSGLPDNPVLYPDSDTYPREFTLFEKFAADTLWGKYLPDIVRLKLIRVVYDIGEAVVSEIGIPEPKVNYEESRILSGQNYPSADTKCYLYDETYETSLSEILTDWYKIGDYLRGYIDGCIENLCANKIINISDNSLCYFINFSGEIPLDNNMQNSEIISEFEISKSILFWKLLKHICANSKQSNYAEPIDDNCHRAAASICKITQHNGLDNLDITDKYSYTEPQIYIVACGLGVEIIRLSYENEIDKCYSQLEILLTSPKWFSALDRSCILATEKCEEFKRNYHYFRNLYIRDACSHYMSFYPIELFWKNIPLLCSENDLQLIFAESKCYNFIQRFCENNNFENLPILFITRHERMAVNEYNPSLIRGGNMIHIVLCDKINGTQAQTAISSNSNYKNLKLIPNESKITLISLIDRPNVYTNNQEQIYSQLSEDNSVLIAAATECTSNSPDPIELDCIIKLWKACFNILSSKAKYESRFSELTLSSRFVCTTAWLAELARMASVLSSSFPEDYKTGNFTHFSQYIVDQATKEPYYYGELVLRIDENGKAQPNLNLEGERPEVAESLTALGNSIAQLVQPYLSLPATNQQIVT